MEVKTIGLEFVHFLVFAGRAGDWGIGLVNILRMEM
jgi:hypothetical protein